MNRLPSTASIPSGSERDEHLDHHDRMQTWPSGVVKRKKEEILPLRRRHTLSEPVLGRKHEASHSARNTRCGLKRRIHAHGRSVARSPPVEATNCIHQSSISHPCGKCSGYRTHQSSVSGAAATRHLNAQSDREMRRSAGQVRRRWTLGQVHTV